MEAMIGGMTMNMTIMATNPNQQRRLHRNLLDFVNKAKEFMEQGSNR